MNSEASLSHQPLTMGFLNKLSKMIIPYIQNNQSYENHASRKFSMLSKQLNNIRLQ
jgi:hypothetical protein